jgi:ribosomal protein L7/L12
MTFLYFFLAAVAVAFALDAFNRRRIRNLQQSGVYPPPGQGGGHDVERLVALGKKIDAIKLYRQIHRTDLKTAKEAVDKLADRADLRQR